MPVPVLYYTSMQKDTKKGHSLEAYAIFPYVAWGLTIGFAFFVYTITLELKEITSDLQQQTQALQERIEQQSHHGVPDDRA